MSVTQKEFNFYLEIQQGSMNMVLVIGANDPTVVGPGPSETSLWWSRPGLRFCRRVGKWKLYTQPCALKYKNNQLKITA